MLETDYLIVGGGSAGAVLASRLSQEPSVRVLLIEAGIDTPPEAVPADIADTFPSSSLNPDYFWPGLKAQRKAGGALYPFPQARIMGGGSSIMGMWALRGVPSDFERWVAAGATGWGPSDVLPYYRKLENDVDRDGADDLAAPYAIRRAPTSEWPSFARSLERAAASHGLRRIEDINENPSSGFFAMPVSRSQSKRSSSASAYLTAAVRSRANLKILSGTTVSKIRFAGLQACGVTILRDDGERNIEAKEIILSAGSIHSPALLMRSGVGPAEHLRRLGIGVVAESNGVGQNLQNHPYLNFALTLPRRARQDRQIRNFAIVGARLSSGLGSCPPHDLLVFAIGRASGQSWGTGLALFGASLYAPFSRGSVTLVSREISDSPAVSFSLLSDPRDPPRLVKAARVALALLLDSRMAGSFHDAFLLPPIMAMNQFNRPGVAGQAMNAAANLLLSLPPLVSRAVLGRMLRPGRWVGNLSRKTQLTDGEILASVAPMGHVTSTCAMGRRADSMSVVDHSCRVNGVRGLRVVDASIMPSVPSANTNLTTMMIAERAYDLIRAG